MLSWTLSLLTQFRECSGTDRLLEPIVPPLVVSGWTISHAYHSLCHTYSQTNAVKERNCLHEIVEYSPCEHASVNAGGRFIPMSGNNIQLRTPPHVRCPAKPLQTINYVHHFIQYFHSDLGQQTFWAVGWSHFGASITSHFSRWGSRISTKKSPFSRNLIFFSLMLQKE